ncbi:hypothetical protein N7492_003901 [Penicillium capsulatum]|uniref:LicD/FKTN/FKRP nucleotidyltransferase domain-containing protein n=1 Tax=Penicillium capsulatum TaxID=69766 RepID=A0A9W9IS03_9EURO|nr:hypothetical protein N7492_003901 [Penicillium capsulatum]
MPRNPFNPLEAIDMQCRGLPAILLVFCALVVSAPPRSHLKQVNKVTRTFLQDDPTLVDPLWLEYGLNASEEYKYFHEPGRDDTFGHYDIRFFTTPVDDTEREETLTLMIRAYLGFFEERNLATWLAHGTLLVVSYTDADSAVERRYLLEINPWSRQRTHGHGYNLIDARWIDVDTGLFIDITGLSRLEPYSAPHIWQCKDSHKYRLEDIYPLRRTIFEGVAASVPFQYEVLLMEEYSETGLGQNQVSQKHSIININDTPIFALTYILDPLISELTKLSAWNPVEFASAPA